MLNYDIYMKIKETDSNFDFIKFAVPIIDVVAPIKYSPNGKYTNEDYLIYLIDLFNIRIQMDLL